MATQNHEILVSKIVAATLDSLRGRDVYPQVVNRENDLTPAQRGSTIQFNRTRASVPIAVTPGPVNIAAQDTHPDVTNITLDNWEEVSFEMNDRVANEIMDSNYVPEYISQKGTDIMARINASVADRALRDAFNMTGTFAANPHGWAFASGIQEAVRANDILFNEDAPERDWYMVLNGRSKENLQGQNVLVQANTAGTDELLRRGTVGRLYDFDVMYDRYRPGHTAGTMSTTGSVATVGTAATSGWRTNSPPVKSVSISLNSGTATLVVGDIVKFSNHDQTYRITTGVTLGTSGETVAFEPELRADVGTSTTLTCTRSHSASLAFQRNAIALAIRPALSQQLNAFRIPGGSDGFSRTIVDPVTRVPFRLEYARGHKQDSWFIDVLWGVGTLRPEHIVAMFGQA